MGYVGPGVVQRLRRSYPEATLVGLDTGCVWGGKLSAVRLADRAVFQVRCPQYQAPG